MQIFILFKRLKCSTSVLVKKKQMNFQLGFNFADISEEISKKKKITLDKTSEFILEKLREQKQQYIPTKDQYRIDVGLLIDRYPIFYTVQKSQVDLLKFRIKYGEKYKFRVDQPKSLLDFKKTGVVDDFQKNNADNGITHKQMLDTGEQLIYRGNSKLLQNVDPEIKDPKSIQYAPCHTIYLMVKRFKDGIWEFPNRPMTERESMVEAKQTLQNELFKKDPSFKLYYKYEHPVLCEKRELYDYEKQDQLNNKFLGVKTFYFYASHLKGSFESVLSKYQEYIFTTRLELNQYMDEVRYKKFVHSLKI